MFINKDTHLMIWKRYKFSIVSLRWVLRAINVAVGGQEHVYSLLGRHSTLDHGLPLSTGLRSHVAVVHMMATLRCNYRWQHVRITCVSHTSHIAFICSPIRDTRRRIEKHKLAVNKRNFVCYNDGKKSVKRRTIALFWNVISSYEKLTRQQTVVCATVETNF